LDYLTTHTSLSPIRRGFAPGFVNYNKGCTRLAAASDKVYQLLAHGRWFSPGTPASSTTKTGRHDIAEILLKVALKHQKSNQINNHVDIECNTHDACLEYAHNQKIGKPNDLDIFGSKKTKGLKQDIHNWLFHVCLR
jgi:hypothetical protein